MAEARFEEYPRRLKDRLGQLKPLKLRSDIRTPIYELQIERGDSPLHIWRALRTLGLVEQNSIIAFREEGELRASPLQVEEAEQGGCRKLQELGVAELEDGILKLTIVTQ
jgi:hypothetical protein